MKVCIDLGASETRTQVRKDEAPLIIPNNMKFVGADDVLDLEVAAGATLAESLVKNLDVTITASNTKSGAFPRRVLLGALCDRTSGTSTRPTALMNKMEQTTTYISSIVAAAVMKLVNPTDASDDKVTLLIALPPAEVSATNKERIKNNLVGTYKVAFNKLGRDISFEVANVVLVRESHMAILGWFMNGETGQIDANKKREYGETKLLSIDIGNSTTDLALIDNMGYVEKSGKTIKIGMCVAKESLANDITARFGFDPNDEVLEDAVRTGRIRSGKGYLELTEELHRAKNELANAIIQKIQPYFVNIGIPISLVSGFIVSGGGSMESSYVNESGEKVVTCPSVSSFITDNLSTLVKGIDVIQVEGNPRLANIKGIMLVSQMMSEQGQ